MARPVPQVSLEPVGATRRVPRSPKHPFAVKHNPWQIAPFCIAPVLPGETLKSFSWRARAVSDPVKSPLVGWSLEYYFFYVKFRDLQNIAAGSAFADAMTEMMTTVGRDMTDVDDITTSTVYYHPGTASNLNFTKECVKSIVEWWFRNDGEAWDDQTINGLPAASLSGNSWLDSMTTQAYYDSLDVNVDLDSDTNIMASEIERSKQQYELLRMQGMTVQTYEEFLMTYGVRPQQTEILRPELLRMVKTWQYPSNTVDASTGVPTSALSWSVDERGDKDRYFKEPGFIIGLTCARPKVYRSNQVGSVAHLMNEVYNWLPATLREDKAVGQKAISNANALLSGQTGNYWVDLKDLFVYGDQFVNFALTDTDMNLIALPAASSQHNYATYAMAQALFSGTSYYVRQDGICTFNVLGSVVDEMPWLNRRG